MLSVDRRATVHRLEPNGQQQVIDIAGERLNGEPAEQASSVFSSLAPQRAASTLLLESCAKSTSEDKDTGEKTVEYVSDHTVSHIVFKLVGTDILGCRRPCVRNNTGREVYTVKIYLRKRPPE
jgi:hypothetical protein